MLTSFAAAALLANKAYRDLLQPYDERRSLALGYMHTVNPGVATDAGALSDPKVRWVGVLQPLSDPNVRCVGVLQPRSDPNVRCVLCFVFFKPYKTLTFSSG